MTPTVIDTDPGIDDALALLLAWSSPELAVEAITTVAGNVPVPLATVNAWRLVMLRRPTLAPNLAEGAAKPLGRPLTTATHYHGDDGLGDVGGWPATPPRPAPAAAVDVLVEMARRHGPDLTVIALGPLTNLAVALERAPDTMRAIGRLVVMGGAVDVPGNVTPRAEFNMHVDPEAARRVFAAGLPLELVPLDATRQAVLSRHELETALARRPGRLAERIAAFTARAFQPDRAAGAPGMTLHDPLAVGVAIDSSLVTWAPARLTIGPDGETDRELGPPNCRVAAQVDRTRFVMMFIKRLCPTAR